MPGAKKTPAIECFEWCQSGERNAGYQADRPFQSVTFEWHHARHASQPLSNGNLGLKRAQARLVAQQHLFQHALIAVGLAPHQNTRAAVMLPTEHFNKVKIAFEAKVLEEARAPDGRRDVNLWPVAGPAKQQHAGISGCEMEGVSSEERAHTVATPATAR